MIQQSIEKLSKSSDHVQSTVEAPKRSRTSFYSAAMSDTDLAYLAGLFDGEGCLSVGLSNVKTRRKDGKGVVTVHLIFMVINTHLQVLEWVLSTVNAGRIVEAKNARDSKLQRRLRCYRFVLDTNHNLTRLLPLIRPYLKIKTRQVDAAISFLQRRAERPPRSGFDTLDVDNLFDIRLANRKLYEDVERIAYRKALYTRDEFRKVLLEGRDGSAYRVVEWTPEMDALVGTNIDRVVAGKLGLKLAQVQRRRVGLGVPTFSRALPSAPAT